MQFEVGNVLERADFLQHVTDQRGVQSRGTLTAQNGAETRLYAAWNGSFSE